MWEWENPDNYLKKMVEIKGKNIIENVYVEGWKGKGDIELSEGKEYYKIIEKRKSKETGEIYEDEHTIPKENVKILWDLIKENCDIGSKYEYRYLVRLILENYKFHEIENQAIEQFIEAFNGGKNRATYYFPYLYYPVKILEAKGLLLFFGRGGIMRIGGGNL